jgi:hypothetical protein
MTGNADKPQAHMTSINTNRLPLVPATPRIERDVTCACGYNLRGLDYYGRCPECGFRITDLASYRLRRARRLRIIRIWMIVVVVVSMAAYMFIKSVAEKERRRQWFQSLPYVKPHDHSH